MDRLATVVRGQGARCPSHGGHARGDRVRPVRHFSPRGVCVGLALMLGLISGMALAQSSSASYQIPRQSIDGGGGRASSASYTLHGTIGQPDAGATMTSASYTLRGGFHLATAAAPLPDPLFSDGFEAP